MSYPILAIDRDIAVFERERAGWVRRGIDIIQVDTMCDAVETAGRGVFLFITINADNIDYLPMLPVLRKVSAAPVFVITSNYTVDGQVEALHNGAKVYAPFQRSVEENMLSALALLHSYEDARNHPHRQPKVIAYRKLLILPDLRKVCYENREISFTKKEMDIFLYLHANCGITVSFSQIYRRVWGIGYENEESTNLWNHIINIRKKIKEVIGEDGYIESVHGIGFHLPPSTISLLHK